MSFARPELCSQLNVSGLWDGMVRWNAGQEDRWDLFLEKGGSILKGILIVTVIQDEKVVSVVEQQVIGELSNQEITFKGTSGKFIYESGSKYSLDSFSGLIMDSGGTIKGDVISGNSTGTVTLTMARTK